MGKGGYFPHLQHRQGHSFAEAWRQKEQTRKKKGWLMKGKAGGKEKTRKEVNINRR